MDLFPAILFTMTKQSQQKALLLIVGIVIVFSIGWYMYGTENKQHIYPSPLSPTNIPSQMVTITFSPAPSSDKTGWKTLWQIYTDATLRATFEYPTSWKLIDASASPDITGTDYTLAFEDLTVADHRVSIYLSSIGNPENLSLADFYRRYMPGGAERYANISFQETINPHGVRFEKIIQPYVSPDYNDTLETVHNSRIYEITKEIAVPFSSSLPVGGDYHQDPIFQKAVAEYNHLINSFTFTN